jgi:hypothetical protein
MTILTPSESTQGSTAEATRARRAMVSGSWTAAVLRLACPPLDDRDRNRMVDAELPVEPGLRGLLDGEFEHQRVHGKIDPLDIARGQRVLIAQLDTAIDRWMDDDLGGEEFVGVE